MLPIRHGIVRSALPCGGRQHFGGFGCLQGMPRKKKQEEREVRERSDGSSVYDIGTPIWDKYYHEVRKHVKFPRYYKKALNW